LFFDEQAIARQQRHQARDDLCEVKACSASMLGQAPRAAMHAIEHQTMQMNT
jgi:hypothetical protein